MHPGQPPRDAGTSAVEFALVSVLLFMVLFGIMQYGYGFFQLQGAQAAAHDAARQAALGLGDCSNWTTAVKQAIAGNGLSAKVDSATMTIADSSSSGSSLPRLGDTLTVKLTYTPGLQLPFIPYPGTLTTTASSTVENIGTLGGRLCTVTTP